MANYGHINVGMTMARALEVVSSAVTALFGDLIIVEAPGTGSADPKEAKRLWLATGENAGFAIEVEKGRLAFRHGVGPMWLDWVRGCVEEEVSDRLGLSITYDATGESHGPGDRRYRRGSTFRGSMTALFDGVLNEEDERFAITPPQFLEER